MAFIYSLFIDQEFQSLLDLSGRVEPFLIKELEAFADRVKEEAKQDGVDSQELFELRYDDLVELRDEYPQVLRRSVFLFTYSRLERYLQRLCDCFYEYHSLPIGSRELRGMGVERSARYLQKMATVTFPRDSPEWSNIKMLAKLRNYIMHADERVRKTTDPGFREALKNLSHVDVDDSGKVVLAKEFLPYSIGLVRAFVRVLQQSLDEWDKRSKPFKKKQA